MLITVSWKYVFVLCKYQQQQKQHVPHTQKTNCTHSMFCVAVGASLLLLHVCVCGGGGAGACVCLCLFVLLLSRGGWVGVRGCVSFCYCCEKNSHGISTKLFKNKTTPHCTNPLPRYLVRLPLLLLLTSSC